MSQKDVEQISISLKGLSISATIQSSAAGTTTQISVSSSDPLHGPVGAETTSSSSVAESSIAPVDLERLSADLSERGGFSPESRVRIAFDLGLEARRARINDSRPDFSKPTGLPAAAFVLLAHPSLHSPRWFRTQKKLLAAVGKKAPASTIYCSLPSQARAESFCLGAGLEGLPSEA